MGKKKINNVIPSPDSDLQIVDQVKEQTEVEQTRYVVVREGYRVSDVEYDSPTHPDALKELERWRNHAKKFSWGEPVEIVKYDNKLHRVW